jgi:WhiB family redox-sensing transcriptional regulator
MAEFADLVHLANCIGVPTRLFFPERGESSSQAKAVCEECLIRSECLEEHIDEPFGVWGGASGRRRYAIRNPHNPRVPPTQYVDIE